MRTRNLILTGLFAALTAVGAFLRIPTPISSFTLQTFFTCLSGVLLGAKCGALSQAVYVLLGLVGLPVFTAGGGLSYILQPTFGFLPGSIPMAAVIGGLSGRSSAGFLRIFAACLAGTAVLYLVGLPYMHCILTVHLRQDWTLRQTLLSGMAVFLPWDVLKAAVTALLGYRLLPRLCRFPA